MICQERNPQKDVNGHDQHENHAEHQTCRFAGVRLSWRCLVLRLRLAICCFLCLDFSLGFTFRRCWRRCSIPCPLLIPLTIAPLFASIGAMRFPLIKTKHKTPKN